MSDELLVAIVLAFFGVLMTLVVGAFGVVLQWLAFKDSSNQLIRASDVLARLEGMMRETRGTVQGQSDRMLTAILDSVKQNTPGATYVLQESDKLLNEMAESPDTITAEQIGRVREWLDQAKNAVGKIRDDASVSPTGLTLVITPERVTIGQPVRATVMAVDSNGYPARDGTLVFFSVNHNQPSGQHDPSLPSVTLLNGEGVLFLPTDKLAPGTHSVIGYTVERDVAGILRPAVLVGRLFQCHLPNDPH